ncbi:hypothetical protein JZM24_13700 [Candidatus Sodalis endolongispinus]|uniref:Uncharacterized protein n=1 Tax=Candidatus Sodalis endolongispinus TaxID=2812662 RepID=A0ABS5YD18_9GAMM|nr:hypothetical protein [Candidatus Sodalis endolongispinus]MBT9432925.1 hypothetical protein [Candidatus Sodalis endolongispinus]
MGSFYLGGSPQTVAGDPVSDYVLAPDGVPVSIDPNGTTSVGQTWVQYFLPAAAAHNLPLSFWHGGSLTGAMWESTPDGREGWLHYFLRHGWPVYNVDAVWSAGGPAWHRAIRISLRRQFYAPPRTVSASSASVPALRALHRTPCRPPPIPIANSRSTHSSTLCAKWYRAGPPPTI